MRCKRNDVKCSCSGPVSKVGLANLASGKEENVKCGCSGPVSEVGGHLEEAINSGQTSPGQKAPGKPRSVLSSRKEKELHCIGTFTFTAKKKLRTHEQKAKRPRANSGQPFPRLNKKGKELLWNSDPGLPFPQLGEKDKELHYSSLA